jgi:putative membrane protein
MTADRPPGDTPRFHVEPRPDTHFSWLRTRMSAERTLMSWVRTGVSLIGFGFTIFQFFERFSGMQGVAPAARPQAPWYVGLALIATGTAALIVSAWQYRSLLQYLRGEEFRPVAGIEGSAHATPTLAIAVAMILVGALAFLTVLLRF